MKWNPWARPFTTGLMFDGAERPVLIARLSVSQQANFRIGLTRLMGGRGTAIGTDLTDEERQRLEGLAEACRRAADRGLGGTVDEGDPELVKQVRDAGQALRRLVLGAGKAIGALNLVLQAVPVPVPPTKITRPPAPAARSPRPTWPRCARPKNAAS